LNMDATTATSPTTPQALEAPRVAITAAALPENSCSGKHKQHVKVSHFVSRSRLSASEGGWCQLITQLRLAQSPKCCSSPASTSLLLRQQTWL
jgi:hypothetical protein